MLAKFLLPAENQSINSFSRDNSNNYNYIIVVVVLIRLGISVFACNRETDLHLSKKKNVLNVFLISIHRVQFD